MSSKLKEVLAAMPRAAVECVAREAGTTPEYLTEQVANGHRRVSVALAKRLVKALDGQVVLGDLRPDVWPAEDQAEAVGAAR